MKVKDNFKLRPFLEWEQQLNKEQRLKLKHLKLHLPISLEQLHQRQYPEQRHRQ